MDRTNLSAREQWCQEFQLTPKEVEVFCILSINSNQDLKCETKIKLTNSLSETTGMNKGNCSRHLIYKIRTMD